MSLGECDKISEKEAQHGCCNRIGRTTAFLAGDLCELAHLTLRDVGLGSGPAQEGRPWRTARTIWEFRSFPVPARAVPMGCSEGAKPRGNAATTKRPRHQNPLQKSQKLSNCGKERSDGKKQWQGGDGAQNSQFGIKGDTLPVEQVSF